MTEPRHIAAAISQLGHDTLTRAWAYLLDTHAGVRAHVPGDIRRKGLLVHASSQLLEQQAERETEALAVVREWTAKGLGGVLVGPVGCGKSHAAFGWLMHWARAGHSCRWSQAGGWRVSKAHEADVDACRAAHALVIDDLGAGNVSAWILAEVNSLLCWRLDRSMPTLLVSNLDRFELRDGSHPLLDERTTTRMLGRVRYVDGECLRTEAVEPDAHDLDREGRGWAWQRARALIEIFGVEASGVPISPPLEADHRPASYAGPTFGARLAARLSILGRDDAESRRAGLQAVRAKGLIDEACKRAGVDVDKARRLAAELAATATDIGAREALDAALASMAKAAPPKPAKPRERVMSLDEYRARQAEIEAVRERFADAPIRKPRRADLERLGYRVREHGEGWAVYFGADLKADGAATQDAAWEAAAMLHAGE